MPKCDFNKVACKFIKITLQDECYRVNLLHIFKTPFLKNNTERLLLTEFDIFIKNTKKQPLLIK